MPKMWLPDTMQAALGAFRARIRFYCPALLEVPAPRDSRCGAAMSDRDRHAGTRYDVHSAFRQRWAWEVRWFGGRIYARCDSESDAQKIVNALNAAASQSQRAKP